MPYLSQTLASIASQTFVDYEVLVWIMDSIDDTDREVANWIPALLSGRIFRSGQISLGAARSELVNLARGDFCACIDADDLSEPDRLTKQITFLRAHPDIALVGSWLHFIDSAGRSTGETLDYPTRHDDIVNGFILHNCIGQPSVTFRRSAILAVGNYSSQEHATEDYDLWLRVACHFRLANLPQYLVHYRRHAQSITQELATEMAERTARVFAANAPALFGLTTADALALQRRQFHRPYLLAFQIARHRAFADGNSIWSHLRRPSLLGSLRALSPPSDRLTPLILGLLDSEKSKIRTLREFMVSTMNSRRWGRRLLQLLRALLVHRRTKS